MPERYTDDQQQHTQVREHIDAHPTPARFMRGEPSTKRTGKQEDAVDLRQDRRQRPGPQVTCPGRQHQQEYSAYTKDTGVTQKQRSERIEPSWRRVAATPAPQQ